MNPASQHQNVFISFVEDVKRKNGSDPLNLLGTKSKSKEKYCCDKCRFSSKDLDQFQKHVLQHAEMTFSCSYCSHVSYTRGESQRHLVQHTGTFPYKCQFCEYGAVRNDYIMKHTQRVHKLCGEKSHVDKKKLLTLKNSPSPSSLMPGAKEHVCAPSVNAATAVPPLGQNDNGNNIVSNVSAEKTNGASSLAKVQVELLAPLNEPIQHDRPLTVAYPPELSIPAGCFVELVEIKTVNGTKELELKLVSQHATEAESAGTVGALVDNGRSAKSSFHCSLIPQEEKAVCSDANVPRQHVQEVGPPSSAKGLLATPLGCAVEARRPSKETAVKVKEEPEEHLIELAGKAQSIAHKSVEQTSGRMNIGKCEADGKSESLVKLKDPSVCLSSLSAKVIVKYTSMQCAAGTNERLKTSDTGERLSTECKKEMTTSDTKTHPVNIPTCTTVRETSHPMVIKSPVKHDPEVNVGHDAVNALQTTRELPIISSVFSLSQGCVEWERPPGAAVKSPEPCRQSSPASVVAGPEPTTPDNSRDLQGEVKHEVTNPPEEKTTSVSGIISPLETLVEKEKLALSSENGRPEVLPADADDHENAAQVLGRRRSRKDPQDSSPVFIPQGAVLKITDLNCQPASTLKHAAEPQSVEESWVPRPVLSCSANGQNPSSQITGLKLSLKRRRSGAENEGLTENWRQLGLQQVAARDDVWESSKHRKKRKKHKKTSKTSKLISRRSGSEPRWLIPLKEDQLVKFPGPNQPVVVLNQSCRARGGTLLQSMKTALQQAHSEPAQRCHALKMKLKKVHQNEYQVVGFILKGFFNDDPRALVL